MDPLVQVLPNTGVAITVSFYNTPPQQLADQHPIVRALLAVCPKERRGCRTAATQDLMNAAGMSATQVSSANTHEQDLCCLLSRIAVKPSIVRVLLAVCHNSRTRLMSVAVGIWQVSAPQ